MTSTIPPPAIQDLLPPLLACLPTAFGSTRPIPALLPLLSPILRQRVQLLSDSTSSPSDSWLTKLSWDRTKAEKLPAIVDKEAFEPHPVSCEIEFQDAHIFGYRRLDEETLHSRIDIRDLGLTVIYLWCIGDEAGGGDGWSVAEVLPLDEREETSTSWSKSTADAEEAHRQCKASAPNPRQTESGITSTQTNGVPAVAAVDGKDDDDDYWARYDNAPSTTPGPQPSQGAPPNARTTRHGRTTSEAEYFSRYAEVQPDMDNDDPSTDRNAIGESSLNGNVIASTSHPDPAHSIPVASYMDSKTKDQAPIFAQPATEHPRPQTAASDGGSSAVVDKLEDSASMLSQTELAVRQHVASTMKSLYRLARSTGMEMAEVEGLIKTEVEMLRFEEGMEEG
ncbi:MAG: hypothetical protein LQ338_003517 [Usnochroma carphineum]|nr:MAG: hypothetical protein LQ338_003517 [Usnochroma carphineum]